MTRNCWRWPTTRIDVIALFPDLLRGALSQSLIGRARDQGILEINLVDLRPFGLGSHRVTDDTPFGGGPGMVLRPEPVFDAVESITGEGAKPRIILLSPRGRKLTQTVARELSQEDHLLLICGRYEGVDERVRLHLATDEISIGDYILAGGESAAWVLIETITRLVPGVVGNESSVERESFERGLLDFPSYTRPQEYRGWRVPDVLLSGHHAEVEKWRRERSIQETLDRRPELLREDRLDPEEKKTLHKLRQNMDTIRSEVDKSKE